MNLFKRFFEKKPDPANGLRELWEILSWAQKEEARYLQSGDLSALERAVTNAQRILNHPVLASQPKKLRLSAFYDASRILFRRYSAMGDPADLDQSIATGRQAIIMASQSSPEWIACANNLGAELRDRYRYKGTLTDLEQSISLFRQVLEATPKTLREDRAMYLNNLGSSLGLRYQQLGNVADLEEEISLCKQAIMQTPPNAPTLPARLVNLGLGLRDRSIRTGNIADLEQAIQAFEQAVAHTPPGTPDRDLYLNNLGLGLNDRYVLRLNFIDLERAIKAYEQAIAHAHSSAPNLPLYLTNLGSALVNRYHRRGDLTDLDRSIGLYEQASKQSLPRSHDYLRNLSFLSSALINKYQHTDDLDILEQAIRRVEQVVAQTPRDSSSLPSTLNILGSALKMRYKHTKNEADLVRGFHTFRQAVAKYGQDIAAEAGLANARDWGDWALERQTWAEALEAYDYALKASERLFQAQLLPADKESWLREFQGLPARAAYALAQIDNLPAALAALEQGRARLLGEALARNRRDLERLPELEHDDLLARYRALNDQYVALSQLEAQAKIPNWREVLDDNQKGIQECITAIRAVPGYEDFLRLPTAAEIQAVADQMPLVYLATTSVGSLTLVATADHIEVVWSEITEATVSNWLVQREGDNVVGGYLPGQLGNRSWLEASLQDILPLIGEQLIAPVTKYLRTLGASAITLIPSGRLGLLPLHAATYSLNGKSTALLDEFEVRYAPSAQAVQATNTQLVARLALPKRLAGVGNPLPNPKPLAFGQAELEDIVPLFEQAESLYGKAATKSATLAVVPNATHVHFSCHGRFDVAHPLQSALSLSGSDRLTLNEILSRPIFNNARLVVLSACQTAITDFNKLPDEAIGLPAGFLQAGVPGVVGTLWSVNDLSTALLMIKFYTYHLKDGLTPAQALRKAQLWLRDVTNAELTELFDVYRNAEHSSQTRMAYETAQERFSVHSRAEPDEKPFAHPYYWAPFVFYGV
jgi:CHAT domain-containing protein